MALSTSGSCGTQPEWQPTVAAYEAADTDTNLRQWWQGKSSTSHTSFANELGRSFGGQVTSFECGIGDYSSCPAPACSNYQAKGDPAWAYLGLVSTVNLNTLFNAIHIGVSNGQQGFGNRIEGVALTFFPEARTDFSFGHVAFWIVAVMGMLVGIVPGVYQGAAIGVAAVAGASIQHISYAMEPEPQGEIRTVAHLRNYAATFGETTRKNIEVWANQSFSGEQDAQNNTILDYLVDGSYVENAKIPSHAEIEAFYQKQMIARVINAQWRKRKIFVMFTSDPDDTSGPDETRYYSEEDRGVYYTYLYKEDGPGTGHLDKPPGMEQLNGSVYGITGNDVTKASAGAWRAGGFNYTPEIAFRELQEAIASNGTRTPYADGAGWSGTWTLPVCDIGRRRWNTKFGEKPGRYGMLPCCCGPDCRDTKAFVEAANMLNFQTLYAGCKKQLENTDLNFTLIDYGFGKSPSSASDRAATPAGKLAGIVFAALGAWLWFF